MPRQKYYRYRRSLGLCMDCNNSSPNTRCLGCEEKRRTIRRAQRAKRRLHGTCPDCGQEPLPSAVRCGRCTSINRIGHFTRKGLPAEEIERIREAEKDPNKRCANPRCQSDTPGANKDWQYDHDHKTNKFRGILCQGCNLSLGLAKDDPEILQGLIEYLALHRPALATAA